MANPEEINEKQDVSKSGANTGKADIAKRFIALIIDGVISGIISLIPFGGLLGAAYMLLRDGLDIEFMDNRSIGKKIMKLRPVTMDGSKCDLMISVKRNWMFALGPIVMIPIIGWILIPIVGLAAMIIAVVEVVLVLTDDEGRRWGDKLADTKVIEVED